MTIFIAAPGYCGPEAGKVSSRFNIPNRKNYAIVNEDSNWGYCSDECFCKYTFKGHIRH